MALRTLDEHSILTAISRCFLYHQMPPHPLPLISLAHDLIGEGNQQEWSEEKNSRGHRNSRPLQARRLDRTASSALPSWYFLDPAALNKEDTGDEALSDDCARSSR